jgi:hypothetical protein
MIMKCFVFYELQNSLEYSLEIAYYGQAWWLTSVIPAIERLRQEVKVRGQPRLHSKTLSPPKEEVSYQLILSK